MRAVRVDEDVPQRWADFFESQALTIKWDPFFSRQDKIFTIGSCFAEEVRAALTAQHLMMLPRYQDIPVDWSTCLVDTLPKRIHMNFYNTFSIRQEFERAAGEWTQDQDDYWTVNDNWWSGEVAYQDPYRRGVYAISPEILLKTTDAINTCFAAGVRDADVFFITLGLTEVWRKKDNGLVACQRPGYQRGGGHSETEFHASTYEENYANMKRTMDIIFDTKPDARVVVTVSPVPLARTFTRNEIYVANMESKSTLRAVAGRICSEYKGVRYFPSYEMVTGVGLEAFQERDGRHVKPEIVERIMKAFVAHGLIE